MSDRIEDGRRIWSSPSDDQIQRFLPELVPDRCYEQRLCRPDTMRFDWCETACGADVSSPVPPAPIPVLSPEDCPAGEPPFVDGCGTVGPLCSEDLPAGAILVESGDPADLVMETNGDWIKAGFDSVAAALKTRAEQLLAA